MWFSRSFNSRSLSLTKTAVLYLQCLHQHVLPTKQYNLKGHSRQLQPLLQDQPSAPGLITILAQIRWMIRSGTENHIYCSVWKTGCSDYRCGQWDRSYYRNYAQQHRFTWSTIASRLLAVTIPEGSSVTVHGIRKESDRSVSIRHCILTERSSSHFRIHKAVHDLHGRE